MHLAVEYDEQAEAVVARVEGEIDSSNAGELTDRLGSAASVAARHPARLLLVDLQSVSFLGSAGLRALLDCRDKGAASGIGVRLVAARHEVTRPIELTNLDGALELYPSVAAALGPPAAP